MIEIIIRTKRYRYKGSYESRWYQYLPVRGWIVVSLYTISLVGFIVYHLMKL